LEEKVSENYDDDSVWETYVPEVGGMYSEGVWRSRNDELFKLTGWNHQGKGPVFSPKRETIIYRRRKTEAKPEPADDGIHTRVIELAVGDAFTPIAVRIDENGAGEFVTVQESIPTMEGVLSIEVSEWPALRAAIDRLIAECRE
jgi:hypothetical protein